MASEYDISVILKLLDKFSKPAKEISGHAKTIGDRIREIGESAGHAGHYIEALLGPAMEVTSILGASTAGIAAWGMKGAFELDRATGYMETSLEGLAGVTDQRMKEIVASLQKFTMDFPMEDAQKKLVEGTRVALRMYGDIPTLVDRVTKGAKAGLAGKGSPAEAISLIAQVQHAYNDTSEETYNMLANLLPKAIHTSRMEFNAFSHAVGRAAPLAAAFGISIQEFLGSGAELTKVIGGRSSIVGFQLASVFDALRKFKDVPIVLKELEKETPGRGWINFLKILNKALKGNEEDIQGLGKLYEKFGSRGAAAMELLTNMKHIKNIEELVKFFEDGEQSLNYTNIAIEKLTTGTQDAVTEWININNTVDVFQAKLGDVAKLKAFPWLVKTHDLLKGSVDSLRDIEELMTKYKQGLFKAVFGPVGDWFKYSWKTWVKGKGAEYKPFIEYTPMNESLKKFLSRGDEWLDRESKAIDEIAERGKRQGLPMGYLGAGTPYIDIWTNVIEKAIEAPINALRQKLFETSFVQNVGKSEITVKLQADKGTTAIVTNVNKDPNTSFELENSVFGGSY